MSTLLYSVFFLYVFAAIGGCARRDAECAEEKAQLKVCGLPESAECVLAKAKVDKCEAEYPYWPDGASDG